MDRPGAQPGLTAARASPSCGRTQMRLLAVEVEDRKDLHRSAVDADPVRGHGRELRSLAGLHQDLARPEDEPCRTGQDIEGPVLPNVPQAAR